MDKRILLGRIIAPALLIISLLCFMGGWIKTGDDYTQETIELLMGDFNEILTDDTAEMVTAQLEAIGASVTGKQLIQHFFDVSDLVKSGKISPVDIAFKLNIINDLAKLNKDGIYLGAGGEFEDAIIILQAVIWATRFFLALTIAYAILSAVMTARGGRFWNIFMLILYAGWFFAWFIVYMITVALLNEIGISEYEMKLQLSPLSYIPLIISIIVLVLSIVFNRKVEEECVNTIAESDNTVNNQVASERPNINFDNLIINFDQLAEGSKSTVKEMEYVNEASVEGNYIVCPACGQINDNKSTICCVCGKGL